MKAKSLAAKSLNELKQQLNSLSDIEPTLAICFSSIVFNPAEVTQLFRSMNIPLIAASSAGEIKDDNFQAESLSVMLLDLPKDSFSICYRTFEEKSTYQTAFDLGQLSKSTFDDPAMIIVASQFGIDGQTIIDGLHDGAGNDSNIFGGLAANDQQTNTVWVCADEQYSEDAMAVLVIDQSKIKVSGLASSGWQPIGIKHKITAAQGNLVHEINHKPALDVFVDYFGFFEDLNSKSSSDSKLISGQYPFQIEKKGGYHILRSPIIADIKNKALVMGGAVEEGQSFRFSSSPGFEVINKTVDIFKAFANKEENEAEALLLFSCTGRNAALGPLIEDELVGIRSLWNVPMAGAFTLGEIGRNEKGTCDFHNITCSLVTLKEI